MLVGSRPFFSSVSRGAVHIRDRAGAVLRTLEVGGRPTSVALAPDGRVAVLTDYVALTLVDHHATTFTLPDDRTNAVVFAGQGLVSAHRDGRLLTFAPPAAGHAPAVSELARLPGDVMKLVVQGDWIAAAGADRAVRWHRWTLEPVGATTHDASSSRWRRMAMRSSPAGAMGS